MSTRQRRNLIRTFVGLALCAALGMCAGVQVPENPPSVAFGQGVLYRLEVALLVFYGALLLITPAFSGLIRGRLPIEISTSGAKFAAEAERTTELDEAAIRRLEKTTTDLHRALAHTKTETERLAEIAGSDSAQPGVDSNQ